MDISFNTVNISIDGTDECVGRDCAMCSGDPKPRRTQSFTLDQAKVVVQEVSKLKLGLMTTLTGGGETLLTPDLPKIVEEFLGYSRTHFVAIVTSGFLPEEKVEKRNVEEIMKLKNAEKVEFSLSFHTLGRRFNERFKNTLGYLMKQPHVRKVGVKMTYYDKTIGQTIINFQKVICELAREESPMSSVNEYGLDVSDEGVRRFLRLPILEKLVNHYSEKNMHIIMASLLTLPFKYIFRREYASKEPLEVWLFPQEVSLHGKGANIDIKRRTQPYQCATIFGDAPLFARHAAHLHIGFDGNYYPSCGCPYDESIRLGTVGIDPLIKVLERLVRFEFETVERMSLRRHEFHGKIPCSECIRITKENSWIVGN